MVDHIAVDNGWSFYDTVLWSSIINYHQIKGLRLDSPGMYDAAHHFSPVFEKDP